MEKELILGPPGTGKTSCLIENVSELIESGVPPQRIAYVSFTRKAADHARDRARERLGLPLNAFPYFRTLHSIAFRQLGLSTADVMNPHHWKEISDMTGAKLVPSKEFENGMSGDLVVAFHLHLANVLGVPYEKHFRNVAGSQRDRRHHFGALHRGGGLQEFLRLGEFIDNYKQNSGLVDFSDMLKLGAQCPPLDIDYAIVDEAQDLSPTQWLFCQKAFANCRKVIIAGDDDQAIYSWAGADLHTFRNMQAKRTVLDHSWRLPREIWRFAQKIAEQIKDRYHKDWGPREEDGAVQYVHDLSDCALDNGETWYLLTRTRSQQQAYVCWLRGHGYPYRRNGVHAVKSDHLQLAKAWTRLLRGEAISAAQVRSIYANLREDALGADAAKLETVREDERFRIKKLVADFGLQTQTGVWHDVLIVPDADSEYYRKVKERLGVGALIEDPKIHVNTIHGVKGGEADNVVFSNSMGRRPYRSFRAGYTRDDEARIFYVAATRAKKRLYIRNVLQCQYPLPAAC